MSLFEFLNDSLIHLVRVPLSTKYMFLSMRIFLIAIFTFLGTSLFAQHVDCQEYRNGKFKITDENYGSTIIERKGDKQIEYNERAKIKVELKVDWVENCKFILTLDQVLENPGDIWFPENAQFTVEIIETMKDSYIQRTTSTFSKMVSVTEAIKVD